MKKFRNLAALAALAAGMIFAPAPACAQMSSSAPIVVKEKPLKPVWMKAEVIRADARSVMVREEANGLMIHTFTYSEKANAEMQQYLEMGGFQYGDKVKIRYLPGKTEALDIQGVPSKPL